MIIDCDRCEMRDVACDDCVVTVLLGSPPVGELEPDETVALRALADGGLVPPLRMRRPPGSGPEGPRRVAGA
jgi:hypothetical protein